MASQIKLSWQETYIARDSAFAVSPWKTFFTFVENTGFYQGISVHNKSLFHPFRMLPTNLYHRAVRDRIKKDFGLEIQNKNYPYKIEIDGLGSVNIGAIFHFFPPNIVSIRVNIYDEIFFDKNNVFNFRKIIKNALVSAVYNIKTIGNFRKYSSKPMIEILYGPEDGNFIENEKSLLTALLINDTHYRNSSRAISDKVVEKNQDHNLKNINSRAILIDKQGMLVIRAAWDKGDHVLEQEISKKRNLFELGLALQAFYSSYPSSRGYHERRSDYIFATAVPFIKEPDLTFTLSYSNKLAWRLITKELELESAYRDAVRVELDRSSLITRFIDRNPHPNYTDENFWARLDSAV